MNQENKIKTLKKIKITWNYNYTNKDKNRHNQKNKYKNKKYIKKPKNESTNKYYCDKEREFMRITKKQVDNKKAKEKKKN